MTVHLTLLLSFTLMLCLFNRCDGFIGHKDGKFILRLNVKAPKIDKTQNTDLPMEEKKNKFSFGGLFQLVMMGAGAPMLGEYKETDENGRMLFELEANNYADSEGNSLQTKAPFFEKGYEGDRFDEKPPGFWANLLSGGRLQAEWEDKIKRSGN